MAAPAVLQGEVAVDTPPFTDGDSAPVGATRGLSPRNALIEDVLGLELGQWIGAGGNASWGPAGPKVAASELCSGTSAVTAGRSTAFGASTP